MEIHIRNCTDGICEHCGQHANIIVSGNGHSAHTCIACFLNLLKVCSMEVINHIDTELPPELESVITY